MQYLLDIEHFCCHCPAINMWCLSFIYTYGLRWFLCTVALLHSTEFSSQKARNSALISKSVSRQAKRIPLHLGWIFPLLRINLPEKVTADRAGENISFVSGNAYSLAQRGKSKFLILPNGHECAFPYTSGSQSVLA